MSPGVEAYPASSERTFAVPSVWSSHQCRN